MKILLYLILIGVGLWLLKFCFAVILQLIKLGLALFFLVGMVVGFLALVGLIEWSTAGTISKWAFYIGCVLGVITAIGDPQEFIDGISDVMSDSSYSSKGSDFSDSGSHADNQDSHLYCKDCTYFEGYGKCSMCPGRGPKPWDNMCSSGMV